MKKEARSQSAVEYLIIVSLTLAITIPAVYFFFRYSSESDMQIQDSQVNQMGREIMESVETVYFSGDKSRVTLDLKMPRSVVDVYIQHDNELVFKTVSELGKLDMVFFTSSGITIVEEGDLSDIANSGNHKLMIQAVDDGSGLEVRIGKFTGLT